MSSNVTVSVNTKSTYRIVFNHQSQHLTRQEWVSLITLCLAPMIAHLLAGIPRVIYLHDTMPKWHDKLVLYDPTSIIWRYFAITEWSICSSDTSLTELAAINVVYWTHKGWQGSDEEIRRGKALCIQRAPRARDRILSIGTLKTLIVAIQGISAAGALLPGPLSEVVDGLGQVFFPLAFIGLLRLPAAYWLTDHFIVMHLFDMEEANLQSRRESSSSAQDLLLLQSSPVSRWCLDHSDSHSRETMKTRRPTPSALAVRILYVAFLLFGLSICLYRIIEPMRYSATIPLTWSAMTWLYLFWLVNCTSIILRQVLERNPPPIVIPCANSTWYKFYTCVLLLLAVGTTIIAALETRRTLFGFYTARPVPESYWKVEQFRPDKVQALSCLRWAKGTFGLC